MPKGLFFSLPSVSVSFTLAPIIQEVAASGIEIIYYNTKDFQPPGEYDFQFKPYPSNFPGYYADKIDGNSSYFDFGNILVDCAECLVDFLKEEITKEQPTFIIHSHLAVWGKLLAKFAGVPSVTLYTTFVLDKQIMFSFHRQRHVTNGRETTHVGDALKFYRKSSLLYKKLLLKDQPDLWDVYINKGKLNLSFILPSFQPEPSLFGNEFHFLGYPTCSEKWDAEKNLIYVSMGTIMNKDISFYSLIINVLKELHEECLIAVGSTMDIHQFGVMPPNIKIVGFTEQRTILKKTKLFITRGGMASVHEAVYSCTPMIVIPVIPEQQITAATIEKLGIGLQLSPQDLNEQVLDDAIQKMLGSNSYVKNLECLANEIPVTSPGKKAAKLINDLLYE
ncbi:MAG: nucleotide disphospho-sugar-binding domain-containing protein [Chitinophagaceae bacterium]